MEGKTNFSRRQKQFDGMTWLTPTSPLFYDYATAIISHERHQRANPVCVGHMLRTDESKHQQEESKIGQNLKYWYISHSRLD